MSKDMGELDEAACGVSKVAGIPQAAEMQDDVQMQVENAANPVNPLVVWQSVQMHLWKTHMAGFPMEGDYDPERLCRYLDAVREKFAALQVSGVGQ